MELQQATSIYGGYLIRKREREEEAKREREKLEEQPAQALLQHRVHFPDSVEKRPSRQHTQLIHFN